MTIEEAQTLYDKNEGQNSFANHVTRCLFLGVLVKRDEFLLMAEPVFTNGKRVQFQPNFPVRNCWWVYLVLAPEGTTPGDFMDEAPYPLPYVAFKRRGKIKIYNWNRLRKDIYGRRRRSLSTTTT